MKKYVSPLGAWALAFGCAVGWGAFVMPGNTFLPLAGPVGTVWGMSLGGLVMLIIGMNYQYALNQYPDNGGTFSYTKYVFGYDHGLLSTWYLALVYIAIVWANASAVPLILRSLLPGMFEFGPHYTVYGFDIYGGEVLLSLSVLVIASVVCMIGGQFSAIVQIIMACMLLGGVIVCVWVILLGHGAGSVNLSPGFTWSGHPFLQVIRIVTLAPWAYVGFESISHSSEEFSFNPKHTIRIMVAALIGGVIVYSGLGAIAASARPVGYRTWLNYISNLEVIEGLAKIPTFYAAHHFMGDMGLILLGVAAACGIMTGLVGNMIAASRLIHAMAKDDILPGKLAELNPRKVPVNAILLIFLISLPIPFIGRTAISWIVDVNTIGATIAYAYTSACAARMAVEKKNSMMRICGFAGLIISLLFMLYFLVPNFWSVGALSKESYMILIVWSILGFLFFRYVFARDQKGRFGQSTVVWMFLLFMILFVSMLWFRQASTDVTGKVLENLSVYNIQELQEHGVTLNRVENSEAHDFLQSQMDFVNHTTMQNSIIQLVIILVALLIMFSVYNAMKSRQMEIEVQKKDAEVSSQAKSTFLSNMSHDIRTPMNAIIGYTEIAKKVKGVPQEELDYLEKIEASSRHLLSLINDVLDMSRIESGKMELDIQKTDLKKTVLEVKDLFSTQMEMKKIKYEVLADDVKDRFVMCDANRLNRVLLNLISNSYKFTPEKGSVTVSLAQTGEEDGRGFYELRVKDTGMGMSKEFAAKVFEAYERERTANSIQGTGLGMAITKNIVDLMGGEIQLETEQGKGTEFIISVSFELTEGVPAEEIIEEASPLSEIDCSKIRILLVEDQEINRDVATIILEDEGFMLDYAVNGREAVDKVTHAKPGDYDVVLMDIQMPVMNGYDAARAIRSIKDPRKAEVPIIAMTANAFSEDVQAALDAGMNGHLAKPIEIEKVMEALAEVLQIERVR